ncbi:MAG: right-handed parallel beta-helix repeat-containing protein [Lachnospiraceae bacterium]|nr:right-handed parallel beta-helix repeat-containing protein [Lachnospiraceae bacterium]
MKCFVSFILFCLCVPVWSITITAKDIGEKTLQDYICLAQSSDEKQLVLDGKDGTFVCNSALIRYVGIDIEGINNCVIDFTPTIWIKDQTFTDIKNFSICQAKQGRPYHLLNFYGPDYQKRLYRSYGFKFDSTKTGSIKNIKIFNSQYAGVWVAYCNNVTVQNVEVGYARHAGIRVTGNTSDNIKVIRCYAHGCCDDYCLGEEADGFFYGNEGCNIYTEDCVADCNSDDGWDLYGTKGNITFVRCIARYNGLSEEEVKNGKGAKILKDGYIPNVVMNDKTWTLCGDGNGFKLGGMGDDYVKKHTASGQTYYYGDIFLKDCIAYKNLRDGFTRNDNPSRLQFDNCSSLENSNYSYYLEVKDKYYSEYKYRLESEMSGCFESGRKLLNRESNQIKYKKINLKKTKENFNQVLERMELKDLLPSGLDIDAN